MPTTVLSEKGQIVIPAEIRTRLGLERGDRFEIQVAPDGLLFKLLPRNPLLRLRGAYKGSARLTDALIQEHHSARSIEDA